MEQWPRNARLYVDGSRPAQDLPLSPEDFFVLSRIEGQPTVAEVLQSCGLPSAQAHKSLERLLALGAVRWATMAAAGPSATEQRKRKSLLSQFEAARTGAQTPEGASTDAELSTTASVGETSSDPPVRASDEAGPARTWPSVDEHDPRIMAALGLPVALQRTILALVDQLDTLSPFEILGLAPTHDGRAIRRAYHQISRDLHPDAYFGQELGPFRERLALLFGRAKMAHEALRNPAVREPYVEAEAMRRALQLQQIMVAQAEDQTQRNRRAEAEAAEAAARRQQLEEQRRQREQERLRDAAHRQAQTYIVDADLARARGNLAAAANLYRLALQLLPEDPELRCKWEQCRDEARRRRAGEAFSKAMSLRDLGHVGESIPLLIEAAQAYGTAEHLAWGAEAAATVDPALARELAMGALDALRAEAQNGSPARRGPELARLHVMLAKAFHAAGQLHTAREQLGIAQHHHAGDPEIRALLNSLKLP